MRLTALEDLPSFGLLGPGFAPQGFTLVAPLAPATSSCSLVYAPYEAAGGDALRFAGEPVVVDRLEIDAAPARLEPRLDETGHAAAVEEIRAAIAAGDVYQVNLTLRAQLGRPPGAALFALLARRGIPRFAAWVRLPGGAEFVSASPELLFEIDGRGIRAEPMKGTARPDAAGALDLSEKDRAELAMITDLVRNDLTPVSQPRTVRVACERRLVPLPYAIQAVSEVESALLPGVGPLDVLAALHPGGSVTGAPKGAAMAMISRLERARRGPYCGALGLLTGARTAFSLLIRTAWRDEPHGPWTCGVGGGIVWESDARLELEEARLKLGAFR